MMTGRVELLGVSRRYPMGSGLIEALADLTLSIEDGAFVAVTGPSGSGKSTLLHLIGGMDAADEGTIRVDDYEVTSLTRSEQVHYRRKVGFVFQRFHLLPALTARDNVVAPVLPWRTPFDKYAKAESLLGAVGLADRSSFLPSRLSGGEQQRVAIARALINDPMILLADEPTGNLDTDTGKGIIDLLLSIRDQRGMTTIVATHDASVAERCDQMLRLQDGRLILHPVIE